MVYDINTIYQMDGFMSFKGLREERGLRQQDVADRLGITQAAVASWETGKSVPGIKTLLELSKILHVDVDTLCHSFPKIAEADAKTCCRAECTVDELLKEE